MAQRLATEYVKTCLQLTEAELSAFIRKFTEFGVKLHVHVLENGNQEILFQDDKGQEITFSFEYESGVYVCSGACRLRDLRLVNLMRKTLSQYKGNAIVNRIYSSYIMVYQYERGSVIRIEEVKNGARKLIYQYRDTLGELEQLFRKQTIEQEIERIHGQINDLLDLRNNFQPSVHKTILAEIDERLRQLTHRLFVLEV